MGDMSLISIAESDNFLAEYDRERGMYRVSFFNEGRFQDEIWFDAFFENKKLLEKINAVPIIKIKKSAWDAGYCPKCASLVKYNYSDERIRKRQYCWKCGQLVDFD